MIWTHSLNPVAFSFGFLEIHWYGLAYAVAFLLAYLWLRYLAKIRGTVFSVMQIDELVFAVVLGVVVGGRLGYFIFYHPDQLFSFEFFQVWHGGMSFHGGLIGVVSAIFWMSRKFQRPFFEISDLLVLPTALGLMLGRIGNFINGELWGRPTGMDFGVIFPHAGDVLPRHPSQIYEALKNLLIAMILFFTFRRKMRTGTSSFLFLILYGVGRIIVEQLWREPLDGYYYGVTRGSFFSIPVLLMGIVGIIWIYRKK